MPKKDKSKKSKKKNKDSNSKLKKLVTILIFLVMIIPITVSGYLYFSLNSIYDNDVDKNILDNNEYKFEKGITNILLVGSDSRTDDDEPSRSDSMMILTIDNNNKQLKLTSLARDTYVNIEGHGMEKLTHAYVYGGIDLLIDTIESNFMIDIQDYASLNFFAFMDLVDTLGGVEVDVKSSELSELNKYAQESYDLNNNPNKGTFTPINSPGVQTLNGYQTLSYARIRKNDDAFGRDERQRAIVQGITNGLKSLPISKYPSLINSVLPYIKTSINPGSMMSIGTNVLRFGNLEINQFAFPINDGVNSQGGIVGNDGWVLQFKESSLDVLHDFIFNPVQ